jgi:hypothetical protein
MTGPVRLLLSTAVSVAMLTCAQAQEPEDLPDFCPLAGALGHMLGYIERQCPNHRLTPAGQTLLIETTARISSAPSTPETVSSAAWTSGGSRCC